jgi:hypothetical protein
MVLLWTEAACLAGLGTSTLGFCGVLVATAKPDETGPPPFPIARDVFSAGWTTAIGSCLLNPTDVCKIRMQNEEVSQASREAANAGARRYATFSGTARLILAQEGAWGLWSPGIVASALRDHVYSGIRIGLYPLVKGMVGGATEDGDIGVLRKLLAGMLTGSLGSALANPTDLVKIRIQGEAGALGADGAYRTGLRQGSRPSYNNSLHGLVQVLRSEGVRGLYSGTSATITRAACGTGAQLAAYDHTKYLCKQHGVADEGFALHVFAAMLSGLAFATAAAPADIIKSRIMQKDSRYAGFLDCAASIVRTEGPRALFKGWLPSACRLTPLFMFVSPVMERLRLSLGLGYFAV